MDKLTLKQEQFCFYYLQTGNATKAAELSGYSPDSARSIASENLTKPNIIKRVEELKTIKMPSILTPDERQQILTEIAKANKHLPADPIKAIDTLNKMDKLYDNNVQINIDNRKIVFQVGRGYVEQAVESKSSQLNVSSDSLVLPEIGTEDKIV